jgi:uncharacterized membrane protein
MTESVEKEILQRLTKIETLQAKMEERNAAEHQEIMSSIESLRDKNDSTNITNGKQNERLIELETAFSNHVEEERKEKSAFMWRFGIIITLIVFGGDLITKFFGM